MSTLIIVIIFVVFAVLFSIILGYSGFLGTRPRRRPHQQAANTKTFPCPVCGTTLTSGERVSSVAYPGESVRIVHVFGCPYCYPNAESSAATKSDKEKEIKMKTARRICPVCRKELPLKGYLYCRMTEGADKKHLHVMGCTDCPTRKNR